MKKRIAKYGIIAAVIFAVTLFIFSNSFAGYDTSHSTSDSVSEIILPDKYSDSATVLLIIRKLAHLIEYALLGIVVMSLVKCIEKDHGKKLYATASFYVLAVAVLDEHIQSFSDRTSSTGDIILDFCGALAGFIICLIIIKIYERCKLRCEKNSSRVN